MCKLYLRECTSFNSPHAEKTFKHNHFLTCSTEYVIYLILDKVCSRAYTGRTENSLCVRWPSHKSHIKKSYKKCKVAVHFNIEGTEHGWTPMTIDATLPAEIEIIIIDKVVPEVWDTPDSMFEKLCKKEIYWQNMLRTMEEFGGLNDRDERLITQKRHSKK